MRQVYFNVLSFKISHKKINWKILKYFKVIPLLAIAIVAILQACKPYHNITAHYNAYFLANERMQEIERKLFLKRIEDYNKILDVQPFIDTNTMKAHDQDIKYSLEKASIIYHKHDESNWMDNAYHVIAKARFYGRNFDQAIVGFKFVNTQSEDDDLRHKSLIFLIRTFLRTDQDRNALTVINYLKKQAMSKQNLRDFLIMRAHYYRTKLNYKRTGRYLVKAVDMMRHGERKGRIHFIIGQIYQRFEQYDKAYTHYRSVLRNNPPYELAFYARLKMTQVSNIKTDKDIRKARRYFRRLLRDVKNKEYHDKIYYELALFELRQDSTNRAVTMLKKSIDASAGNKVQKAYSYLKLGEVHYAPLEEYELAKKYYDSSMVSLPKNVENYKMIKRRARILGDFVKYLNSVRLEDSLQRMAKMDTLQLSAYLDKNLKVKIEKAYDEEQRLIQAAKDKAKRSNNTSTLKELQSNVWYFYNPQLVARGRVKFQQKWGTRVLEDNWRRSNKDPEPPDSLFIGGDKKPDKGKIVADRVKKAKEELYKIIPFTPEAIKASDKKLEDGFYELGKIYNLHLNENKKAIGSFEELLKRFSKTKYEAEVLYFLYLINKNLPNASRAAYYKQQVLKKYPNSVYKNMIINPNWLKEAKKHEKEVKEAYKKAYEAYQNLQYEKSQQLMDATLKKFPQNLIQDKFSFLKVLIISRTQNKEVREKALLKFIKDYPGSNLKKFANNLLKKSKAM
ncbi:tetratricopeptide repeat domain protein [Microscilla marina ATCC 23134]|uniref:Tetratricopeptide repeat domain protein n=1 Tax=Microscilla marina ATCC 23134 TaxID=313606 RepID=A1ZKA5_MICM2|nr:tetratricopeptide repeat domain protein [Microscilla marina ATCC 23134]